MRLIERLFKEIGAREWNRLIDIFIDAKNFGEFLSETWMHHQGIKNSEWQNNTIYYTWSDGFTSVFSYDISHDSFYENIVKIYWSDDRTIEVEEIRHEHS